MSQKIKEILFNIVLIGFLVALVTLITYIYLNYEYIINPEASPTYRSGVAFGGGTEPEKFPTAWNILFYLLPAIIIINIGIMLIYKLKRKKYYILNLLNVILFIFAYLIHFYLTFD